MDFVWNNYRYDILMSQCWLSSGHSLDFIKLKTNNLY